MSSIPTAAETLQRQEEQKEKNAKEMLGRLEQEFSTRIWHVSHVSDIVSLELPVFILKSRELIAWAPYEKRIEEYVEKKGLKFIRMEEKISVTCLGEYHYYYYVVLMNPFRYFCLGWNEGSIPYCSNWRQGFLYQAGHEEPVDLINHEFPWYREYWKKLQESMEKIEQNVSSKIRGTMERTLQESFEKYCLPGMIQLEHELRKKGYQTQIVPETVTGSSTGKESAMRKCVLEITW